MHRNETPSMQLIKKWVQNFKETGSTTNQPLSGRPRTSWDPENVESVRASVREQFGFSTRKRSCILNVSEHI
jgi:hypothetical protein